MNFKLPGPEQDYPLHLNLDLVEALEEAGGSLLKIADDLVSRELKLSAMLPLLRIAYGRAGCTLTVEELDAFLLCRSPASLLADLLMAILTPLHAAGAVTPGEE
ncbi:MAG: hypothetical protein EPN97_02095 [Alphaproteobacteria bacterium]|nr:MAG: hypothetical protein EPN97_02095 [Alphaproteobacteria bacterium]